MSFFHAPDAMELLHNVSNQIGFQNASKAILESSFRVCLKQSVYKRLIRALIVAGIAGKEAKRIIARDVSYPIEDFEFEDLEDEENEIGSGQEESEEQL